VLRKDVKELTRRVNRLEKGINNVDHNERIAYDRLKSLEDKFEALLVQLQMRVLYTEPVPMRVTVVPKEE
jgi:hypothetical protein